MESNTLWIKEQIKACNAIIEKLEKEIEQIENDPKNCAEGLKGWYSGYQTTLKYTAKLKIVSLNNRIATQYKKLEKLDPDTYGGDE